MYRDHSGAVAIEFAFVAPVLFAIILSTIDFGMYMWTLNTVQMAADEAARQGAVQNKTTAQVEAEASANLFAMQGKAADFTITATDVTTPTNYLQVNIQYTYNFMFPVDVVFPTTTIDVTSQFPKE